VTILRTPQWHGQRLQALSFDLDDTFWEVGPVILHAEHAMYDFLRRSYPGVTERHSMESMRDLRARLALERPDMRHDFTWLRREALSRHALEAGYAGSMVDEAFEVFFTARNEVRLHEDVVPALEALAARRLRLFVITNGNADLERIGIARFFERVVHARLAGALKPDPAIFSQLLSGAALAPATVAHVGDDPHADVAGARRAGMRSVWLNRGGSSWPAESPGPDHEVGSLADLVDLPGLP